MEKLDKISFFNLISVFSAFIDIAKIIYLLTHIVEEQIANKQKINCDLVKFYYINRSPTPLLLFWQIGHWCNVNLRKLLSAYKSHVRETSLFTGTIPDQVRNYSQAFRFGARSKSEKVKLREPRGATAVAIGDDSGRVVAQERNRNRISDRWE